MDDVQIVDEPAVKEEVIESPIEPIIPKKAKEEKSYDEKYFKPEGR